MKDAILEIGVEHLPARFIAPALSQLESLAAELLRDERLAYKSIAVHGTLRRLVIIISGLKDKSETLEKIATGPSARFLKDDQGQFTPQAAGFAKSNGIKPEHLQIVTTSKGEVLQAKRVIPGEQAPRVLSRVFPSLIQRLQFPKMMEWEESRFKFARPIRNILALHGRNLIPFSIAGVKSSNKSLGGSIGAKPLAVGDPSTYLKRLRNHCVIVPIEERKKVLTKALDQVARGAKAKIDNDPDLLEETVFLTEHPVPVLGRFKEEYRALPHSLLGTVLKKQLKFFPMLNGESGLASTFIGVRDGISEGQKEVQEGYERVIDARFSDARFFHERDLQSPLEQKLERLRKVTFQRGLGSMYDKMERTLQSAIWLCGEIRRKGFEFDQATVERIARLAYADLVTEVVKEFPELQGIMGGHYCRKDGEDERVAMGVEEFYFPASAKAPIPAHLEGAIASLAGKMDTLCALFSAGFKPTGSEDPFALRRIGTGVVRIVLEKQLPLNINDAVEKAFETVGALTPGELEAKKASPLACAGAKEVSDFLWQRAAAVFEEMGYKPDEIQAVEEGALNDLTRTFKRLAAVHALRPNEEFRTLAAAFKRAANILKQAGSATGASRIEPSLITLDAESSLHSMMNELEGAVVEKINSQDFEGGLRRLVELKPSVDRFFETVRVMDAEEAVKNNRLALLAKLVKLFKSVADISRIQAN